jgi:hypothetical protein
VVFSRIRPSRICRILFPSLWTFPRSRPATFAVVRIRPILFARTLLLLVSLIAGLYGARLFVGLFVSGVGSDSAHRVHPPLLAAEYPTSLRVVYRSAALPTVQQPTRHTRTNTHTHTHITQNQMFRCAVQCTRTIRTIPTQGRSTSSCTMQYSPRAPFHSPVHS